MEVSGLQGQADWWEQVMTREDIIRMLREANSVQEDYFSPDHDNIASSIRFANLVAAAEREAIAKYFGHIEVRVDDKWVWLDDFIRARGEK